MEISEPIVLTCCGVKLTMSPPSMETKRQYADYLAAKGIRMTCAHRGDYPDDVFRMQLQELPATFSKSTCAWGKEIWRASLTDDDDLQHLSMLILNQRPSPAQDPVNDVSAEWIAEVWDQPYKDEGDLYYQQFKEEFGREPFVGNKFFSLIWGFITRPNSTPPQEAGKSTTSLKSTPSS